MSLKSYQQNATPKRANDYDVKLHFKSLDTEDS